MKKVHSQKYRAAAAQIEKGKTYELTEAVLLAKKTSFTTFDGSLEVHVRLGIDPKKSDQQVRGTVTPPHATGQTKRIAVFTEANQDEAKNAGADLVGGQELIDEIKSTKKLDFDIAIAEPALMPKLAVIAKLLGPKGLMPSPKNETVTNDIAEAVAALKRGKLAFKNDDTGNIHQAVGKCSLPTEQLAENVTAFIDAIRKAKPQTVKGVYMQSVTLTATMGPGISIAAA